MTPVFPAYPWQGLVKSIVITKKIAKRSLFMFALLSRLVFALRPDFSNLDALTLKKVYKKKGFLAC
jgi:hypothetical protein